MVLRIGAYPNRHSEKHNVCVPNGIPHAVLYIDIPYKEEVRQLLDGCDLVVHRAMEF